MKQTSILATNVAKFSLNKVMICLKDAIDTRRQLVICSELPPLSSINSRFSTSESMFDLVVYKSVTILMVIFLSIQNPVNRRIEECNSLKENKTFLETFTRMLAVCWFMRLAEGGVVLLLDILCRCRYDEFTTG